MLKKVQHDGVVGAGRRFRHTERVSGSTVQHRLSAIVARWMLKRVQHDGRRKGFHLSSCRDDPIPAAAHRLDQVRANLLAQPPDDHLERVRIGIRIALVDMLH